MLTMSETKQTNAKSTITVDGKETVIATMDATVPESGNISVNSYIRDVNLFAANRETVVGDITAFTKSIYGVEV